MVGVSDALRADRIGWKVGYVAVRGLGGPDLLRDIGSIVDELERRVRSTWGGLDKRALAELEPFRSYQDYYETQGKTYPVLLQAESIAVKARPIAASDPLVRAMFAVELKNAILTAGHDLDRLRPPLRLARSSGAERYTLIGGKEKTTMPGDLMMVDSEGVVASVILGPDERTRLRVGTANALFVAYAPPSLARGVLIAHLEDLAGLLSGPGRVSEGPEMLELG